MGIMFKLIAALVAAASASMADESSEARLSTYRAVERLVLKAWGSRKNVWRNRATRVGYLRLASRYGLPKVARYLKWQRGTIKFWGLNKSRSLRIYKQYKSWGFRRWWAIYRSSIKRT